LKSFVANMSKWGSTCNHNYLYWWLPFQNFILLMMGAWRPKHVEKVCSNKISASCCITSVFLFNLTLTEICNMNPTLCHPPPNIAVISSLHLLEVWGPIRSVCDVNQSVRHSLHANNSFQLSISNFHSPVLYLYSLQHDYSLSSSSPTIPCTTNNSIQITPHSTYVSGRTP
jgi:hypothetical protein